MLLRKLGLTVVEDLAEAGGGPGAVPIEPRFIMALRKELDTQSIAHQEKLFLLRLIYKFNTSLTIDVGEKEI